jgi:hypothetical protein
VLAIFQITINVAKDVVKKYKIDGFTTKWKLYVHINDFYKAYTSNLNPALFDLSPAKKKKIEKKIELITASNIFESVFSRPCKNKITKNKVLQSWLNL